MESSKRKKRSGPLLLGVLGYLDYVLQHRQTGKQVPRQRTTKSLMLEVTLNLLRSGMLWSLPTADSCEQKQEKQVLGDDDGPATSLFGGQKCGGPLAVYKVPISKQVPQV